MTGNSGRDSEPASVPTSAEIEADNAQSLAGKLARRVIDLEATAERLRAVIELGPALVLEPEPERLIARCGEAARKLLAARYAAVGVFDRDGTRLTFTLVRGAGDPTVVHLGSPLGHPGLAGRVVAEERPIRASSRDQGRESLDLFPHHRPVRSFLGVPLFTPRRRYGLVCFAEKDGAEEFSTEDERVAVAWAAQLACAYEKALCRAELEHQIARLEQDLRDRPQSSKECEARNTEAEGAAVLLSERAQRLALLRKTDQALLAENRPRQIAETALRDLHRLIPCWQLSVWTLDFELRMAEVLASIGEGAARYPAGVKVALESLGRADIEVLRKGKNLAAQDVSQLAELPAVVAALRGAGLRAYVRLPMFARRQLIGFLALHADRVGTFPAEQLEVAREVADRLAVAIDHAFLMEDRRAGRDRMLSVTRRLLSDEEIPVQDLVDDLRDAIREFARGTRPSLDLGSRSLDVGSDPATAASPGDS
jgi:GAF domain-containing protein